MKPAGHADFKTTHKFYLRVRDDLVDRAGQASSRALSRNLARTPILFGTRFATSTRCPAGCDGNLSWATAGTTWFECNRLRHKGLWSDWTSSGRDSRLSAVFPWCSRRPEFRRSSGNRALGILRRRCMELRLRPCRNTGLRLPLCRRRGLYTSADWRRRRSLCSMHRYSPRGNRRTGPLRPPAGPPGLAHRYSRPAGRSQRPNQR